MESCTEVFRQFQYSVDGIAILRTEARMPKKSNGVPPLRNLSPNGIPVEQTNLTKAERALLPDSSVFTEDDADAITVHRRRKEPAVPLDEVLRQYGVKPRVGR